MINYFKEGILSTGVDIINLGIIPTPVNYYSLYKLDVAASVQITGSHNPADYNGFKILFDNNSTSSEEIQSIKKRVKEQDFLSGKGNIESLDVVGSYVDEVIRTVPVYEKNTM